MSQVKERNKKSYPAVRGDFILRVDGSRPILFPLDYFDTNVMRLTPGEGFTLSLLSGQRTLGEIEGLYKIFFPDMDSENLYSTLDYLDALVRKNATAAGIGKDGIIEYSDSPIDSVHDFDPREFVISPADYENRLSSDKTRIRLDVPLSTLCVFSTRCSTNCVYCYAERKHSREMSLSRWKELLQEMDDLGMRMCSPDNGDVFARSDGIDFIEALLEHDFHFLLSTKCYVSKENVDRLVAAGYKNKINGLIPRTMQLSIDAVDDEVERKIYRAEPISARTMKTFENFMNCGMSPRVKAVICGINIDQPMKIVDYFYPRGARKFHFVRYIRSFYNHYDGLFLEPEDVEAFKRQYDEIQEKYPDIDSWQNIAPEGDRKDAQPMDRKTIWENRKGCGGGWLSLGINTDGKAFLCEQMMMQEEYIIGDLKEQSIMEVWNSQKMKDFIFPTQDKFEGTICHSCNEFEKCMWEGGRCYRDAYFAYGSIYDSPPLCPKNTREGLRLS